MIILNFFFLCFGVNLMTVVLNYILQLGTGQTHHRSCREGKSETGSWCHEGEANMSLTCLWFLFLPKSNRIETANTYVWYSNITYLHL